MLDARGRASPISRPQEADASAASGDCAALSHGFELKAPAMERIADRDALGLRSSSLQERPRGFGRTHDWADRAQRRMPIPAFVPQVPAAGVLRFRDSAGAE